MIIAVWIPFTLIAVSVSFLIYYAYQGNFERGLAIAVIIFAFGSFLSIFLFTFLIPILLLVVVILYVRIYFKICQMMDFRSGKRKSINGMITILKTPCDGEDTKLRELKTTFVLFITVLFFCLGWLPLLFVFQEIQETKVGLAFTLNILHSLLNPFLYAYHIKQFRQRWERVKWWLCCKKESPKEEFSLPQTESTEMYFKNFVLKLSE